MGKGWDLSSRPVPYTHCLLPTLRPKSPTTHSPFHVPSLCAPHTLHPEELSMED